MKETSNLHGAVKLDAFFLQAANAEHLAKQMQASITLQLWEDRMCLFLHSLVSNVDRSPSGSPSSLARSRRRMILALRVWGSMSLNSISFGATAEPRRSLANPSSSRRSLSPSLYPGLSVTNAFTTSPITG